MFVRKTARQPEIEGSEDHFRMCLAPTFFGASAGRCDEERAPWIFIVTGTSIRQEGSAPSTPRLKRSPKMRVVTLLSILCHHQRLLVALFSLALACYPVQRLRAQDLAPRAYTIVPLHSNAITVSWGYNSGTLAFNGALPIEGGIGTYSIPILTYYHSFSFFGRSASFTGSLPYGVGTFQGSVEGVNHTIYRSGLLDSVYRFSVNLKGGPAMSPQQFRNWRQKTVLGVSLKVIAPTGQYDPSKLVNWSGNRWAFKPEVGYSRRWSNWILDSYGAVWFFTANPAFYNSSGSPEPQSQRPIGAIEGHLSYDIKPFLWLSLDGNFWYGGATARNDVINSATRQTSSRIGATGSFPLVKHQTIKVSFDSGAYIRFGGNYKTLSVAWQYSWLGKPN